MESAEGPIARWRRSRAVLRDTDLLLSRAQDIVEAWDSAEMRVRAAADIARQAQAATDLAARPLDSLRGLLPGRVAWAALADAGYTSLEHIRNASFRELVRYDGIGEQTAFAIKRAVDEVFTEHLASAPARLTDEPTDPNMAQLVVALAHLDQVRTQFRQVEPQARSLAATAKALTDQARPRRSLIRWLLTPSHRKSQANAALLELQVLIAAPPATILLAATAHPESSSPSVADAWAAFRQDPARLQSLLDATAGSSPSAVGGIDADLLQRIEAIELDTSRLAVMLRRYQSFGAKFALAQHRVLLGDDMGLGKTVQALAVICHLSSPAEALNNLPSPRFLIVAPASVLVNWEREIAGKTDFTPFVLHSTRPSDASDEWRKSGGIAVTTYEYLANLALGPEVTIDLLVVDEAHYVKNPHAQRSQRVAALTQRAARVMLMTGTPIENHGAEFVELIRLLDPAISKSLTDTTATLVLPNAFRQRVTPVYLRRNAVDVLSELPPLIEIDEWEEMSDHDLAQYRRAVGEGNFMAMRRAGFAAAGMHRSAKLDRLLEIVTEARDGGHRVIVYSYFLDVLNTVAHALGERALGPLTGAMTPSARQALVDRFASARPGTVLVAQVIAGGVGLNIQSASIVILCEPQLKPSTEQQAIKRAHRMGQLKPVQVHRLLNPDSVDERILEILSDKQAVFTQYAEESDLATQSREAIDSRAVLQLIQGERDRLGIQDAPGADA